MSYDINITGEILIDPPIPAEVLTKAGFPAPGTFGAKDVAIKVVELPLRTAMGTAYYKAAVAIVPCMSSYTAYRLTEHVQQVVDHGSAGQTFTGHLQCCDPNTGDLWRLEIHDDRAVEVKPRIVWPDGSEGTTS